MMKKFTLLIKPHHFLDYLYDLSIDNRHDEPNPNGNANGELCCAFMDGRISTIIFTPDVDDICRPCKCLIDNKCIQMFDDVTALNYGFRNKGDFNYNLDIKLNKALPDIFVFHKEQRIIDVLIRLKEHLTDEIINLYLWKRPEREKNTFLGIKKAIDIYSDLK